LTLAVVALLALAAVAIVWTGSRNKESRAELESAFTRVALGASSSEVQALFDGGEFRHLKLHQVDPSGLLVQTPLKWGARNWVLWIEVKDDKVTALRIRFHDDKNSRPEEAPPDKANG
jgi:type II secretory pathway pseudopilin PulG